MNLFVFYLSLFCYFLKMGCMNNVFFFVVLLNWSADGIWGFSFYSILCIFMLEFALRLFLTCLWKNLFNIASFLYTSNHFPFMTEPLRFICFCCYSLLSQLMSQTSECLSVLLLAHHSKFVVGRLPVVVTEIDVSRSVCIMLDCTMIKPFI